MKQEDIFFQTEGAAWLARNKEKLSPAADPIMSVLRKWPIDLKFKRIFEIGAADGWRLKAIKEEFGCDNVSGCDPVGSAPGFPCMVSLGSAADPFGGGHLGAVLDNAYDLIIYGFCLYLCDREDLFRIAYVGDRMLKEGGHILIWDFLPEDLPYSRAYHHDPRMRSYKMNYAELWLGNPQYQPVYLEPFGDGDDRTGVTIITKRPAEEAWPAEEW